MLLGAIGAYCFLLAIVCMGLFISIAIFGCIKKQYYPVIKKYNAHAFFVIMGLLGLSFVLSVIASFQG